MNFVSAADEGRCTVGARAQTGAPKGTPSTDHRRHRNRDSRRSRAGHICASAMVVVDTSILAYLLIEGDRSRDARALYKRDADWKGEAFMLIEYSNIRATYLRAGALSRSQAQSLVAEVETCAALCRIHRRLCHDRFERGQGAARCAGVSRQRVRLGASWGISMLEPFP